MNYDYLNEKVNSSESIHHEKDYDKSEKRKTTGYDSQNTDRKTYEMSTIKNSFDNISIGADEKGSITVTASSNKSYKGPTLSSVRKKLRGSRNRRTPEHFGEFYTNSHNPKNSAFAFKARKNLTANRILTEFKNTSKNRISDEQRETVPFLNLEKDMDLFSELKSRHGSDNERLSQRRELEREIAFKKELQHRFLRKLRNVCSRNKTEQIDNDFDFLEMLSTFSTEALSDGTDNLPNEANDGDADKINKRKKKNGKKDKL